MKTIKFFRMQVQLILLVVAFPILFTFCQKKEEALPVDPSTKHLKSASVERIPEIKIVPLDPLASIQKEKPQLNKKVFNSSKAYSKFPTKRPDGKKWRIAYLDGGNYYRYQLILLEVAEGLKRLGWITYDRLPVLVDKTTTKNIWEDFLSSERVHSDTIEFVRDAFYSAGI